VVDAAADHERVRAVQHLDVARAEVVGEVGRLWVVNGIEEHVHAVHAADTLDLHSVQAAAALRC
jgi:hypothetical protein